MTDLTLRQPAVKRSVSKHPLPWRRIGFVLLITIILLLTLIPILYMGSTSLKTPIEIRSSGALLPGGELFTENWARAFRNVPIGTYLLNSTLTAIASAVLALGLALPLSYVIARFNFGGRFLSSWVLGTYITPPIVIAVPVFMLMRFVHLIDTIAGLAIIHAVASLPVGVWLLEGFIRKVPKELDESAALDGATPLRTLWSVIVPVVAPGLIATFIICMILSWNEFLFAVILTYSEASQTFPIGISNFIGEHGQQFGEMSAAALTGLIPVYLLALFFQRFLIEGLSEGSVK